LSVAVVVAGVLVLVGGFVDDGGRDGAGCEPSTIHNWVEPKDLHLGRLTLHRMQSPVGKSGRSRNQGVDSLVREKDRVTGGLGELLDAGGIGRDRGWTASSGSRASGSKSSS
jgi:hypothetical protein